MKQIVDGLRGQCEVLAEREQRPDLHMVSIAVGSLRSALTWLKSETGHVQLTLLSAVDWLEDGEFELSYLLTDPEKHVTLIVGCRIPREGASVPTVWDLWPQAVTYEQELSEMFGIDFEGSPRSGVAFILESWSDMPPMRRDFDTAAYSAEHYEDLPGRTTIDARTRVGQESQEMGYTSGKDGVSSKDGTKDKDGTGDKDETNE
ncbi:MAG: NADH-quinone oxidoreductase subunit C [Candidatus Eisenbacteria bacterium]|nr:NADH-quinone oxidoreductase subunit C [Candidatus Eisenbacteria bacterium]